MALYVHPSSKNAIALYETLGFEDTGTRWKVDDDNPDADWNKMARAL